MFSSPPYSRGFRPQGLGFVRCANQASPTPARMAEAAVFTEAVAYFHGGGFWGYREGREAVAAQLLCAHFEDSVTRQTGSEEITQLRKGDRKMSEALPEDVSVGRADIPASRVILTPPICTMGEEAHLTKYNVLATLGNG